MQLLTDVKAKMLQAIEHLKNEFKNIRTNRAHPDMLASVYVEIYGSKSKMKEVANVTAPEARCLMVAPFDKTAIAAVAKAIQNSGLGFNPSIEGAMIRVPIPPMDEKTRQNVAAVAKKKAEEAKITIRQIRQSGNDEARKAKKESLFTEDELKKAEKKIQELTDEQCKEIDKLLTVKEKEILEI